MAALKIGDFTIHMIQSNNILIAFNQESAARILINRLTRANIQAFYQYSEQYQHMVCLQNLEDKEQAETETQAFLASPNFEQEQSLAWQNERVTQGQSSIDYSGMFMRMRLSPVSSTVLLACWAVFILSYFGFAQTLFNALQIQPISQIQTNHQWWRVFSPALFHFDVLHILFNIVWWWVLGEKIEQKMGHISLIILTLVCALLSNLGQLWLVGANFGGLSGVVYGLVGFIGYLTFFKPQWNITLPKSILGFFMVWLVLGFTQILPINIANTAHLVGLISGIGCACLVSFLPTKIFY